MIELLLQAERALSVGLLDRAETLYRQVAAADPRNSIAVVGLARVAIERGNELEALQLGRRALEIDPENAAAQRLVQRLEEVRAYRGEPTPAARPSKEFVETEVRESEPPAHAPSEAPVHESASPREAPTHSVAPPRHRSFLDRLFRRR